MEKRLERWFGFVALSIELQVFPFDKLGVRSKTLISFCRNWSLSCYGKLFLEALLFEQTGVVAIARDEFVVSA